MTNQVLQQRIQALQLLKLIEDQTYDRLYLFVWIQNHFARERAHVPQRRVIKEFSTPRFVHPARGESSIHDVEFRFAHRPFVT